jgi:hypothetical protein
MQALIPGTPLYHPQTRYLDARLIESLRILQQDFIFTQVDKLSSAFAVVCKVKAAQDIINDLLHSSTYIPGSRYTGGCMFNFDSSVGRKLWVEDFRYPYHPTLFTYMESPL